MIFNGLGIIHGKITIMTPHHVGVIELLAVHGYLINIMVPGST